jgi:sugar phosphate isomerase/epimerase
MWKAPRVMPSRVTLSTSCFFPDTELSFQIAQELGYDGVEVMVSHDRKSQTIDSVRDLSTKYEMPISSIHVPCLAISQHVWGWNPELKLRRAVEMAEAVESKTIVVHPPFRWQREYGNQFIDLIKELNDANPEITVAVENMYDIDAFGRRVNPYLHNDDPSLGSFPAIVLDTSHAAAARWDPLDMFQLIGDRVQHMHLSDSTGTRGDEHLPPGDGDLPLGKLMHGVKVSDYSGDVVIEVAFQRVPEPHRLEATRDALTWTKTQLA